MSSATCWAKGGAELAHPMLVDPTGSSGLEQALAPPQGGKERGVGASHFPRPGGRAGSGRGPRDRPPLCAAGCPVMGGGLPPKLSQVLTSAPHPLPPPLIEFNPPLRHGTWSQL